MAIDDTCGRRGERSARSPFGQSNLSTSNFHARKKGPPRLTERRPLLLRSVIIGGKAADSEVSIDHRKKTWQLDFPNIAAQSHILFPSSGGVRERQSLLAGLAWFVLVVRLVALGFPPLSLAFAFIHVTELVRFPMVRTQRKLTSFLDLVT